MLTPLLASSIFRRLYIDPLVGVLCHPDVSKALGAEIQAVTYLYYPA